MSLDNPNIDSDPSSGKVPLEDREFSFKRLIFEEDAQAMAEFVVLLPVYLLLFVVMIYMGHLMIIRQQVVEASRWYAWSPPNSAWASPNASPVEVNNTFFGRFVKGRMNALGRASVSVQRDNNIPEIAKGLQAERGSTEAKRLAQDFLMNTEGNGTNIEKRVARVEFRYNFPWFGQRFGREDIGVPNSHTVYGFRTINGRRDFTQDFNYPIMNYTKKNVGRLQAFDIRDDPFQFPFENRGGRYVADSGKDHENHACFWNREGRLGRDVGSPLFFYPYRFR